MPSVRHSIPKGATMRPMTSCLGLFFLSAVNRHAENDVNIIDIVRTDHFLQNDAVFIDNRPESKFSLGHINGAINLPFFIENDPSNKMTREDLTKAIGDKKVVVFYCTGRLRAYHALKQAEKWGISAKMYWYKNGYEEWTILKKPGAD
jgi:rhodanese-related sulfurtransferase